MTPPAERGLEQLRLAGTRTDLANETMFGCIFRQRGTKEDVVTWEALDSWRAGRFPETPEIVELKNSAKLPQTLARFYDEAFIGQHGSQAPNTGEP